MTPLADFFYIELALFKFNVMLALSTSDNTVQMCSICSSAVLEKMIKTWKYIKGNCHSTGDRMTSMVHWKILGALQSPNRMQKRRYNQWCEVKAVLSRSVSSISPFQELQITSPVQNIISSLSKSIHSSIPGIGQERRSVTAFRFRYSLQNITKPSLLLHKYTLGVAFCFRQLMYCDFRHFHNF